MRARPTVRASRRGAAAVELAVVLTALVPLFFVALDVARVYWTYIILTDSARSGALWLSDPVAQTQSQYPDYTTAALKDAQDLPALTKDNFSYATTTDGSGNTFQTVTVSYNFTLLTTWGGSTTIPISRAVQVRVAPVLPNFN
ncbi:MAG TPA: TadE family protein [Gemmataceae bacterium]|nr:TadE family protein [Gemmataceae bacterium]